MTKSGKSHRKAKAGRKAKKRHEAELAKKGIDKEEVRASQKSNNVKAFTVRSTKAAARQRARTADKEQRRMHMPVAERIVDDPPPFVVLVHGPPGVGKSTLIKCLIKHYTKQSVPEILGPITVVSGKQRRLTFVECPQGMAAMMDAAKYADLVLLVVDGSFGFEMETFEMLNLLQTHGFPKVMGVLTHLDSFKDGKTLKNTKKALKQRFWTEIYNGAKLFYLSGLKNGRYLKREVLNLARFISIQKFRPLSWRTQRPYLLVDRFEDITPAEAVRKDPTCDREITIYGYLRGANMKEGARVHVAGAGTFDVAELDAIPDPCPLPGSGRRRGLDDRERLIYGPMADVGGLMYDKDAVYIDIPDHKVAYSGAGGGNAAGTDGEGMVRELAAGRAAVDEAVAKSRIQMFPGARAIRGDQFEALMGRGGDGGESGEDDDESGSDWSDDEEAGGGPDDAAAAEVRAGRTRRAAVFSDAVDAASDSDAEDSASDDDGGRASDGGASEEDDEGLGAAARWKERMLERARAQFGSGLLDLERHVYGERAAFDPLAAAAREDGASTDDEDEGDGFLRPARRRAGPDGAEGPDAVDVSRPAEAGGGVLDEGDVAGLKEARFVTGDWGKGAERDEARAEDAAGSDDDAAGDFEDVEGASDGGGEALAFAGGDAVTDAAQKAIALAEAEERKLSKAAKKAAFDAAFDEGALKKEDKKQGGGGAEGDEEDKTYYDEVKRKMAEAQARTRAALDALDARTRLALEGVRPGAYVRLRLRGVPCELPKFHDPRMPLLVGGVPAAEQGMGFLQLRIKRHRWHGRLLKNRDPLILSCGWGRFQTVPVYATRDDNGRLRMLKYTPEHMHCMAVVYGPLVPPGTGVVAVQALDGARATWGVAGTGVVLQQDAAIRVVKKLKLVGYPFRIHRHTAFVRDMFTSQQEAAKFEGAAIRTVSGIRGTVKKALRPGASKEGPIGEGSFRATFEDKVLMSDIVFLRAWIAVDLPRLCNPVTNLLQRQRGLVRQVAPRGKAKGGAPELEAPATTPEEETRRLEAEAAARATIEAGAAAGRAFVPNSRFVGSRPGYVFKLGDQGLGYYQDTGPAPRHAPAAPVAAAGGGEGAGGEEEEEEGWVRMRSVAELRRERGEGAPRNYDSLYREIERPPQRKFNPLRIPASLQRELPFKSKPKLEPKRKTKTLEQRRAVVLEPEEKRMATLLQQLNAIRNEKAKKRREADARRQEARAKKRGREEEAREQVAKQERKRRYMMQQAADNRAKAKAAREG
ncbi:unnamed protein product [Pedinophyceae sp. YPF-701]|nr:unnamed protein product [Pedinophyceae sp. YPF-701]